MRALLQLFLLLVTVLAASTPALARAPRIVPATSAEIARQVRNKEVELRLADGTRLRGKATAIDETGITVQARRRPAQTFAWSAVTGVRRGHTTGKIALGMMAGSVVWVGLIASSAPARTEPRHWAPVYLLGGAIPVYLLGRPIEYRPMH